MTRSPLLALALVFAPLASAQVYVQTGGNGGAHDLNFDSPPVATGPIGTSAQSFNLNGIESITTFGPWSTGSDTLSASAGAMGRALVSRDPGLAVADVGDLVDGCLPGAGFEIRFYGPVLGFSARFVDQTNFEYAVELLEGGASWGSTGFLCSGGFPNPPYSWGLVNGATFDTIRISFPNGAGGVGLDELQHNGPFSIGMPYCIGVPNSTGAPGSIVVHGSMPTNDLKLFASNLPTNAFGLFLASRSSGFIIMPGGSQGNLCLGSNIGRFNAPGQVLSSGGDGQIWLPIDLNQLPSNNGTVAAMAGEDWHFQCWYRDFNPMLLSNFTDGVQLTIQ